ncbi:THAP-type domain-containing protein, partial [Aphis craccivora]
TSSHRFPNPKKNKESFDKWVEIVGGDLRSLDPSIVYEKKRICSSHFLDYDISPGTKKLKCFVVPSLSVPIVDSLKTHRPLLVVIDHIPIVDSFKTPSNSCIHEDSVIQQESELEGISKLDDDSGSVLLSRRLRWEQKKSSTFKSRLSAAEKFSEGFLNSKAVSRMTSAAAIFTNLQLRATNQKARGRRFSLEEKLLSLSLYKQMQDKNSAILFDEVSLDPNLTYDDNNGMITGFEDNGIGRTQHFADHNLVFMIRGVPVIQAVHETGLHVVASVCDQGATNKAAINMLHHDTRAEALRNNIQFKEEFYNVQCGADILNVVHIYDPPHLLKGVRNNLLNKNILFTMDGQQMEASWSDITELYELDCKIEDVRMLPRLTAEHVIPNKIKKMKVKCAVQVLSERVASIMSFLACNNGLSLSINYFIINTVYENCSLCFSKKNLNEKAKDTAKFCQFFDKLFDSVNGSYDKVVDGKIYRTGLKRYSPHHELWEVSLKVLQSMYFIDPVSKKKTVPQPPTIKNWIKTIKGFQEVFKLLNKLGIKSILFTREFFRSIACPGIQKHQSDLTLLLNNFMSSHSPGSNCEEDFSDGCLTSYKTLFEIFEDNLPEQCDEPEPRVSDGTPKQITNFSSEILQDLQFQTHNYIAGFVIKKLNSILFKNCVVCLNQVCSLTTTKGHQLTVARDYNPNGKLLLKYPNKIFCFLVKSSIDLIAQFLHSICHHKTLKNELTKILTDQINVNVINCQEHGQLFPKQFFDFVIKLMVHNWNTQINQILSGKLGIGKNERDQIKYCEYNILYFYVCLIKEKKNFNWLIQKKAGIYSGGGAAAVVLTPSTGSGVCNAPIIITAVAYLHISILSVILSPILVTLARGSSEKPCGVKNSHEKII